MHWLKRGPHRHRVAVWDGYFEYCRCGESAGSRDDPKTGLPCITFAQWPPSLSFRTQLSNTLRQAGLVHHGHEFESVVEADLSHLAKVLEAAGWRAPDA